MGGEQKATSQLSEPRLLPSLVVGFHPVMVTIRAVAARIELDQKEVRVLAQSSRPTEEEYELGERGN